MPTPPRAAWLTLLVSNSRIEIAGRQHTIATRTTFSGPRGNWHRYGFLDTTEVWLEVALRQRGGEVVAYSSSLEGVHPTGVPNFDQPSPIRWGGVDYFPHGRNTLAYRTSAGYEGTVRYVSYARARRSQTTRLRLEQFDGGRWTVVKPRLISPDEISAVL
ncbi:MAG TPA: hypothetical protein VJM46_04980 [Candidatus Saccharimonadales bacterium]|nr:hypothetical protein [Candidatus Saccharimonadales bacterium]